MAIDRFDSAALNRARENNIIVQRQDVEDPQQIVIRIQIGPNYPKIQGKEILGDALMAAMKMYSAGDVTTLWIDVTGNHLPGIIAPAIEWCAGFGLAVIVTHGDTCTHEPGQGMPEDLLHAIAISQRYGSLWHPIAKQLVPARPQWARVHDPLAR